MKTYQIVGIGNAIVDVITQADDGYLAQMGIQKGVMQLVEQSRGELLYDSMQTRRQAAGGSVANTIAGLGALGLKADHVIAQEVYRQWHPEAGMGQPCADISLPDPDRVVKLQERDQRKLERHDKQGHNEGDQKGPSGASSLNGQSSCITKPQTIKFGWVILAPDSAQIAL